MPRQDHREEYGLPVPPICDHCWTAMSPLGSGWRCEQCDVPIGEEPTADELDTLAQDLRDFGPSLLRPEVMAPK